MPNKDKPSPPLHGQTPKKLQVSTRNYETPERSVGARTPSMSSPQSARALSAPHSTPDFYLAPKKLSRPSTITGRIDYNAIIASLSQSSDAASRLDIPETIQAAQPHQHPNFGIRILVVDDNPVNRKMIAHQSTRTAFKTLKPDQDFHFTHAENGQRAVELHQQARAEDQPFQVIFMDNDMPVKMGIEAIQEIRKIDPHVFIVVQSVGEEHQIQACLNAALPNAIRIAKPVDHEQIARIYVEQLTSFINSSKNFVNDIQSRVAAISMDTLSPPKARSPGP